MDYTPGPWAIDESGVNTVSVCGHRIKTAEVYSVKSIAWVAQVRNHNDSADARLIAAAPDLLEALKLLLDEHQNLVNDHASENGISNGSDLWPELGVARRAITKAEPK